MKKENINEKQKQVEKNLIEDSKIQVEKLFEKYNTSDAGISIVDIDEKLEEYGPNTIEIKNENTIWHRIKEAFINPFNVVLIIVAIITLFTDVILSKSQDYATFILILSIVLISAIISFREQTKSNNAAKKLKKMISNKMEVIRDEVQQTVDMENIVPGDIVKLSSGDMVPGDVRFLEVKDLFIDQAPLTGESNPVEKFSYSNVDNADKNNITNDGNNNSQNAKTNTHVPKYENITDISNIGFMGTNIVSGSATAIVLNTGNNTYFGSMAKSIYSVNEKNSFERGVDDISKLLIKFMVIMVPIIIAINFFTKNDILSSVIFAITIAVGLTPEMLPVIMTSTLAKGAVEMSKKKTIVKRLGSIQTFGQMNILCTDKTGTLTEDEVVLEKYMDVLGNESLRILKHAFLNSYFQTGLKNLIDVAIIARAEKENLNILKEKYVREDEIPFDFSRRRMSVVLKDENGKRQLITKGAVDEIMAICSFIDIDGKAVELTDELRQKAYKVYEENNNDGLRVLAIAQKNEIHDVNTFGVQDESKMVLIGFIGFLDPPKQSAKEAISALKTHGVDTVVLTGDSEGVALNVCKKVGIQVKNRLTGKQIEELTDEELREKVKDCHLYSKLSPLQKQRIVRIYQENGNTVGYMGDGINDSPPLKQADVGISVDTAVDIAKETADIILLEKDLNVLEEGVINGRKTFTNLLKYIKMATSGNFGNMLSVVIASIFLPFLPMLPVHILIQNLLNDFAQIGMPFDNVDLEYLKAPKTWDTAGIKKFMFAFGIISTVLDILCFVILWFVFGFNSIEKAVLFQSGWFVFGILSQTLIIHMIRTSKIPFIESKSSKQLLISTFVIVVITLFISFTNIATIFDLSKLPYNYLIWIAILMVVYVLLISFYKKIYVKRNKDWL
ncbi:MAG: magnesium-translocating P-type ATPase [Clostridia bacterium]|nr:magnesium-translocating P-type ATPase [Clostridia bacterium]